MDNHIVAIIQARMGSERLPGKVLFKLHGKTVIEWIVERLRGSRYLKQVIIATSNQPGDDVLVSHCKQKTIHVFRGSENDVLDRYYRCARDVKAEVIVRLTGDDPFIDYRIVDRVLDAFFQEGKQYDYVSNVYPRRTYPRGLDTEVFSFQALEQAWREDTNPSWREHVTQYFQKHPELFRIGTVTHDEDLSHYRWALDTEDDWRFFQAISPYVEINTPWEDIVSILRRHPEIARINAHVQQKKVDG